MPVQQSSEQATKESHESKMLKKVQELDIEGLLPLNIVELDALVVVKIIQLCALSTENICTGQLLGLDKNKVLQVTNCFPASNQATSYPTSSKNTDQDNNSQYIKYLSSFNIDSNIVGHYQSTTLEAFMNKNSLANQLQFQKKYGNKSILLIYDSKKFQRGIVSFSAYRLKPSFVERINKQELSLNEIKKNQICYKEIIDRIPTKIKSSSLLNMYLSEGSFIKKYNQCKAFFPLYKPIIEELTEYSIESIDEWITEYNNYQYYSRTMLKETTKMHHYKAKKAAENEQRIKKGLKTIPTETDSQIEKKFKLPEEPSNLESLLIISQLNRYNEELLEAVHNFKKKLILNKEITSNQAN